MRDPYLIPGQVCEVWQSIYNKGDLIKVKTSGFFVKYDGEPLFRIGIQQSLTCVYDYRPVGTEWDFAHDWAACSTVDANGIIHFWSTSQITPNGIFGVWEDLTSVYCTKGPSDFICPDKTRYQGDAWKDSLRMRPDWADIGTTEIR